MAFCLNLPADLIPVCVPPKGAVKRIFAFRVCRVVLPEPALAEQAAEET